MDNIIDFNKKPETAPEPVFEYTFNYSIEGKEADTIVGLFTINPMFYGVTDRDNRLLFAVPAEHVLNVQRGAQIEGWGGLGGKTVN